MQITSRIGRSGIFPGSRNSRVIWRGSSSASKKCVHRDKSNSEQFIDVTWGVQFVQNKDWRSLPTLSTNAPYLLAVWDEIIASRAVLSVCKTFNLPASTRIKDINGGPKKSSSNTKQDVGVKVDVISEDGRKWTRINTCVRLVSCKFDTRRFLISLRVD